MDVLGNKRVGPDSWDFETHAEGPAGKIEFSAKMLINEPSGNIFAQSQNVGMGWDPKKLWGTQYMISVSYTHLRAHET